MKLHQLKSQNNKRPRARIGRGGKRGTTSGRGQKGQKSRSGHVIRPALRDTLLRIPKKRGFRNKPKSQNAKILALADVARKAKLLDGKNGVVVNQEMLIQVGLLSSRYRPSGIKILGKGPVDVTLTVQGIAVSAAAKAAIEKAGGSVS